MTMMIITSIIISFTGVIVRNIEHADPWQINIYRSIAFVLVILAILVFRYRGNTACQLRKIGFPVILAGMCLGIVGVAFTQALTHTTIANTMFTMSAIPFITMVMARFILKEHLSGSTLAVMIIAAGGIIIMVMESAAAHSVYGNLMALISATGFAGFAVIVRANRHIDMLPALIVAGIFVIVVSAIPSINDLSITWHDLYLCILWGGVLSGFGHWVFVLTARYLAAAELTLFMLLEFALSPFWVWVFVGETVTNWALAGGLIVVLSVTARTLLELKN